MSKYLAFFLARQFGGYALRFVNFNVAILLVLCVLLANANGSRGRYVNSFFDLALGKDYLIMSYELPELGFARLLLKPEGAEYASYYIVNMTKQEKEKLQDMINKQAEGMQGDTQGKLELKFDKKGKGEGDFYVSPDKLHSIDRPPKIYD